MEVQIIQARPQIVLVGNSGKCEDCEEEKRKEDLQEDVAGDRVNLSQASLKFADSSSSDNKLKGEGVESEEEDSGSADQTGPKTQLQLSEEERRILNELKARDAEVRAHEAAHLAAAGPYSKGAPTFEFETGPDGRQYATGGEVSIDSSPVPGDPEATVRKAQTIKRAALAPREPSGQDRQVAAQAAQLEAQARQEVQAEKAEAKKETKNTEESIATKETDNKNPVAATDSKAIDNEGPDPFAKRVINQFSPSNSTSGNLLNILS